MNHIQILKMIGYANRGTTIYSCIVRNHQNVSPFRHLNKARSNQYSPRNLNNLAVRSFRTKAQELSEANQLSQSGARIVKKKGRFRRYLGGLFVGFLVVGGGYYSIQSPQEQRKFKVFVGGIRRFLRYTITRQI